MHRLEHQVEERARLRLLDQRERLLEAAGALFTLEAQLHEALVDLALVLDEGDLQFLAVQSATERFERIARDLVRRVRARGIADAGQGMAKQQVRVVDEDRTLDIRELLDRGFAPAPSFSGIVKAQCDTGQQEQRERGLA